MPQYSRIANGIWVAVLIVISFLMIFPFILMLSTSLKSMAELQRPVFSIIPDVLHFENYPKAMARGDWALYFWNSIYVTAWTVVLSLLFNSMAGFAFARLEFRFRESLFIISLIGLMIPPQVNMLPIYVILKYVPFAGGNDWLGRGGLGWLNSYWGLIAPYVAGSFGVFLFRQFYLTFPRALDDAAVIDGMSARQRFMYIYLPLSKPVMASLVALKATATWNEYTWPLIITMTTEMRTVQLALSLYKDEYTIEWELLMAATAVAIIPLLIVFFCAQRYFVEGIVTTGIKG
jgi:multiple sugar transport system permease protein